MRRRKSCSVREREQFMVHKKRRILRWRMKGMTKMTERSEKKELDILPGSGRG